MKIQSLLMKFLKETNKNVMPVAWHPTRWWDLGMSEGEKKK